MPDPGPRHRRRIRFDLLRRARHDDGLAVDVPGMSLPQMGCVETGVNPLVSAFMIQVQSGVSCPKMVE